MSTAARRAHTHQLRRRLDPTYRWYAGDCGSRKHVMVRITVPDAMRAIRELADSQRALARIANWSRLRMDELANQLRRARGLERLRLWRRLAEIDPQLRVFTVTIATPTGSECRLVVQRPGGWQRMQVPTDERITDG